MRYLTQQESRDIDRQAIEQFGMSGLVLMENAGRGAVDTLQRLEIVRQEIPMAIICGKGNNGGDGFVMAWHLKIRGFNPTWKKQNTRNFFYFSVYSVFNFFLFGSIFLLLGLFCGKTKRLFGHSRKLCPTPCFALLS
ncbi:MAG: hypothetical protein LBI18_02935 [Planctomycetaceae bacterium]|jgi:hydroxyethylthiazole kinase-like uncharacterized protein yjeF|nr:hypothetical protein [Planctomycetaceae bacterium]